MPTHHMLKRLIRLHKRERLNHALNTMQLREINRLFRIQRLARRPTMHRRALEDQRPNIDAHITAR